MEEKRKSAISAIKAHAAARKAGQGVKTGKSTASSAYKKPQSISGTARKSLNTGKSIGKIPGRTATETGRETTGMFGTAGNEAWRYNLDGSRKTFDQLSNSEVMTWISTLPQEEQAGAARDFETNYLHNPASVRYDPYYTQWSNNDEARELFGVDVFDRQWIDDNRDLMNYVTFSNESYSTPKKPGAKASDLEKAAYQYWQIANTYEATTQAAENEYAKLRTEIQERVKAARATGDGLSADDVLSGIDWSEYKTLENLRETAKAGNGRMLNRPVQVGDESLRAMVNAAIRGEDVSAARDYVMAESEWIRKRPERTQNFAEAAMGAAGKTYLKAAADNMQKTQDEEKSLAGKAADFFGFGKDEKQHDAKADGEAADTKEEGKDGALTTGEILDIINTQRENRAQRPDGTEISEQLRPDAQAKKLNDWREGQMQERLRETYGSAEVPQATAPDYSDTVKGYVYEYGVRGAMNMVRTQISFYANKESAGTITPEEQAMLAGWRDQMDMLNSETTQRDEIAERTKNAAIEAGFNRPEGLPAMISGPLAWLWNRNYIDALNDADKVPLEDYEEYLRYRLTPAIDGETKAHAEMAKYDRMGRLEATLGAAAAGVAEGVQKMNIVAPAVEEALYWLKSKTQYSGMTRDEIYATDRDLNDLRAFNRMFEGDVMSAEKRQEFQGRYPGLAFISTGIGELIKMGAQADMSGMIQGTVGQLINKALGGMKMANKLASSAAGQGIMKAFGLQNLPFSLDAFTNAIETARDEGATDNQAFGAGLMNAVLVGPVSGMVSDKLQDWGGSAVKGMGKLFGSKRVQDAATAGAVKAAKSGWSNAILSLVKSALTEGAEEAGEEALQSGISKLIYDRDRAWTGEGGVFDWNQMAQSGVMGAALGPAFSILSGLSGALGRPAQTEAERLIGKTMDGETVTDEEIEALAEIEAREAAVQERTEEIEAAAKPEVDQAAAKAEAAAAKTKAAEDTAAKAQEKLDETLKGVQPTLNALNEGTLSFESPEAVKAINEAHKQAAAEKGVADQARAELARMQQAQLDAEQEFEDTRTRVHETARAEAEAQIDAETEAEATGETEEAAGPESAGTAAAGETGAATVNPGIQWKAARGRHLLSPQNETQFRILDELGRTYGIEFDIVDRIKGGKANAMYSGGKRITVALDAMQEAYLQAGVHEMVHYVKTSTEGGWAMLEQVVLDRLRQNEGFDLDEAIESRISEYKEGGVELDRDGAIEEIVAEAVPTIFTNEEATAEIVRSNPSLAQKIRDFFRKFADKLRSIAINYAVERGSSSEARTEILAVIENADALYEIAQTLDGALEMARDRADAPANRTNQAGQTAPDVEMIEANTDDPWYYTFSLKEGGTEQREEAQAEHDELLQQMTGQTREQMIEDQRAQDREEMMDDTRRLAKKVVKDWYSQMDRAEVVDGINEIVGAYQAGENDRAAELSDKLARQVVDRSSRRDDSHREQYSEIRRRLRETPIRLTDTQMQEVISRYGSYGDYTRSMAGSARISREGSMSLDAMWNELSEMHPEMFPPDTGEAEMPEVLQRFVQEMRPRYLNPYGMNLESAAADLSMRLQADVLQTMGRTEAADQLTGDADALRERSAADEAQREEQRRERRNRRFADIAREMARARDSRNDEELRRVLEQYRAMNAENTEALMRADAAEIGIQVRRIRAEANRMTAMISQISEEVKTEELEENRTRLEEERKTLAETRNQLIRNAERLHRQEAITRLASDAIAEEAEWQADSAEMYHTLNEDMKDAIDYIRTDEIPARIERLKNAVQQNSKIRYNTTTTITHEQLAAAFDDLEPEMIQNATLADMWHRRLETTEYQLKAENDQLSALRRQLSQATAARDNDLANVTREQILETQDRISVLTSQKKLADAQEKYCKRVGAESLEQALHEGKLPQPIMERVIAMCADAGRRGRFNQSTLASGFEGIRLNSTTAARVWDDIFGDAAPLMRAIYYDQVMDNETARQAWLKSWRDQIGALKLTQRESELVQKIGENRHTPEELSEASQRVLDAVKLFRQFYDEAHTLATDALVCNGYERPGFIGNYFPHIDTAKSFLEKLGFPKLNNSLPTSINGLTETFKPGKQYSSHLEHRLGEATSYDALAGFEEYAESMSNVIFHTDDIQRHRQLESEIRAAAKNGVFGPGSSGHESDHLSKFVRWLGEYTNLLAGKKSQIDRTFEGVIDRPIYTAATRLKSIKGASAVKGNLSSAITNVVPVALVLAKHPAATWKGVGQMVYESVRGRGNRPESQYMIRKYGSDSVTAAGYTWFSRAMNNVNQAASWAFNTVDQFATNIVVNACYQANLDKGMDNETAMRSADSEAARMMGDRSKGAMPNIYGSQILGFFTQFQLEVANQSQYFRKDLWREMSPAKALYTLFASALTGWLWNEINERLTGRRPAADPIKMVMDVYEAGKEGGGALPVVQAAYNNVSEMFPYMGGGRIAAFEGIGDFVTAITTEGNDADDVWYAARQLAYGLIPMGGQIKKTVRGANAVLGGGYYNSSGSQLYYPVDAFGDDPMTAVQAIVFGPSSIRAARDYYAGDAPKLTESQTEYFETMKGRGYTSTEAYQSVTRIDQSDDLLADAKKLETDAVKAENRRKDGFKDAAPVDDSPAEGMRDEAKPFREGETPSGLLTDYWWNKKDSKAVQNGIKIWQNEGDDWAMPYPYTEEKTYTIADETRWIGPELIDEINEMYAEGYEQIMSGVDPDRLTEEDKERLKKELDKLYKATNDAAKARIKERG